MVDSWALTKASDLFRVDINGSPVTHCFLPTLLSIKGHDFT